MQPAAWGSTVIDVHSQPRLEAWEGPFREAFMSLFLILATLHGDGKGEISSYYPR